ncbi:MAG TPA: response regulator, partial [Aggregatilineales bacterium]|nr:response regulator [Aggregatilineales bacterium]
IPIIMISAVDDLDSVVRCIELGAEDYLFKPFNPVLLKARVSATLDKYRRFSGTVSSDSLIYSIIADAESLFNGAAGVVNDSQKAVLQRIIDNAKAL